jgi:dsDNA-binding SOS-regulon protein
MKNKKMLIGYDYYMEAYVNKQKTDKETARTNLVAYVENVCKLEPTTEFTQGDILSNFKTLFLSKWSDKLPDGITYDKMLFLASVDLNRLQSLVDDYNRIKVEQREDFGIYATNEKQAELFSILTKVCQSVEQSKAQGIQVFLGNILQAYSGALRYDHKQNKLLPNSSYILEVK